MIWQKKIALKKGSSDNRRKFLQKGRKLQKIRIRIIEKEIVSKKVRKYLIMCKINFFLTNGLKMNIVCLVDSSYIHIYQVYRFTSLQVYKVYKFTRFTRTILTCEQYEQDEPGSSIISTNCDECPCLINIWRVKKAARFFSPGFFSPKHYHDITKNLWAVNIKVPN